MVRGVSDLHTMRRYAILCRFLPCVIVAAAAAAAAPAAMNAAGRRTQVTAQLHTLGTSGTNQYTSCNYVITYFILVDTIETYDSLSRVCVTTHSICQ